MIYFAEVIYGSDQAAGLLVIGGLVQLGLFVQLRTACVQPSLPSAAVEMSQGVIASLQSHVILSAVSVTGLDISGAVVIGYGALKCLTLSFVK